MIECPRKNDLVYVAAGKSIMNDCIGIMMDHAAWIAPGRPPGAKWVSPVIRTKMAVVEFSSHYRGNDWAIEVCVALPLLRVLARGGAAFIDENYDDEAKEYNKPLISLVAREGATMLSLYKSNEGTLLQYSRPKTRPKTRRKP